MEIADFKNVHKAGFCKPAKNPRTLMMKFLNVDVPAAVDNRFYCTAAEDYGEKPICAAYSVAAFAENILWKRTGKIVRVEPDWIYKYAKAHDGHANDAGTSLDCAMDALLWRKIFDSASCKIRMIGRGEVGITDEKDVKAAIHRLGCFIGCFNATDEWYDLAQEGVTHITGKDLPSLGGHAVLVCGYDANGVWIENGWGGSWGDNGTALIEWNAFRRQFVYGIALTNCLNAAQ